jgi:hypothetical protein
MGKFTPEIMSRREGRLTRETSNGETNDIGTIFNGTPGGLSTSPGRCDLSATELAQLIDKNFPLSALSGLSFMFNFHDDVLSIGHQEISVQLADGTGLSRYTSDWSQSFSLDSVGFSHVCGYVKSCFPRFLVHCARKSISQNAMRIVI